MVCSKEVSLSASKILKKPFCAQADMLKQKFSNVRYLKAKWLDFLQFIQ